MPLPHLHLKQLDGSKCPQDTKGGVPLASDKGLLPQTTESRVTPAAPGQPARPHPPRPSAAQALPALQAPLQAPRLLCLHLSQLPHPESLTEPAGVLPWGPRGGLRRVCKHTQHVTTLWGHREPPREVIPAPPPTRAWPPPPGVCMGGVHPAASPGLRTRSLHTAGAQWSSANTSSEQELESRALFCVRPPPGLPDSPDKPL